MQEKLKDIQHNYLSQVAQAKNLKELDGIFLEVFGKKGEITQFSHGFKDVSKDELRSLVPAFNSVKAEMEKSINDKREEIREEGYRKLDEEKFELNKIATLDARNDGVHSPMLSDRSPDSRRTGSSTSGMAKSVVMKGRKGHLHPLTLFEEQIVRAFKKLGFTLYDAPHIDSDYYNFGALNIPEEHPARDLWDTLYIERNEIATLDARNDEHGERLLLRTHTSNGQVRIMKEFKPPFRMMLIDRCFRKENVDARHEHTFDQFEIVMVEKGLNMGHLQYLSEYFFKELFDPDIKARMKPKYYPFVEPGAGVDGLCIFCKGRGCKVCGGTGWLELAGAGMIHPTVLKNGGIDPEEYSGIAWGMGPGRLAMLKYGVEDVRLFNSGDLKFLQNIKGGRVKGGG